MFVFRDKLKETDFGNGIRLTNLGGNGNMNVLHWKTPAGTVSPMHDHPEEQFGYLIEGSFEITIGDEKAILKSGDAYFIPGNVPHQFRLLEDCLAIDIFSPQRPVPEPVKS